MTSSKRSPSVGRETDSVRRYIPNTIYTIHKGQAMTIEEIIESDLDELELADVVEAWNLAVRKSDDVSYSCIPYIDHVNEYLEARIYIRERG